METANRLKLRLLSLPIDGKIKASMKHRQYFFLNPGYH